MIKAVLFDIDGVLLDSATANAAFYQYLLQQFGYPVPLEGALKSLNHLSMMEVIKTFAPRASHDRIMEMHRVGDSMKDQYNLLRMIDGAEQVVRELSTKYKLGLVTNRTRAALGDFLHFSQLGSFFACMVSDEDVTETKPSAQPLIMAMQQLGTRPKETVYIGDAANDAESAQGAGMNFIGFGSGWGSIKYHVSRLNQIPGMLMTL